MAYDPQQMLEEHRVQWHQFTRLTLYCTVSVVVFMMLMAAFLT